MRLSGWRTAVAAAGFAAFLGFGGPAAAQSATTIAVGDGTADGSFLQPYSNAWLYSVTLPDGRVAHQGVWTDLLEPTKVDGRPALLRVQGMVNLKGGTKVTLNVFDPKTMQALSSLNSGPNGSMLKREFKGGHVTSTLTAASGEAKVSEFDLPGPVFDFNGGMYGMILAAMPLKEGLSGTFPTVAEYDDKPMVDTFKVLRREEVSAGSRGKVMAWVVESERPGQYRMTFWLTKTAPYIIRLVYETPQPKSPVYSWDMI